MTDTTDQKRPSEKLGPNYDDCVYQHLKQAIEDYLQWMQSAGYAHRTQLHYRQQLNQFQCFIQNTPFSWHEIFTLNTLAHFKKVSKTSSLPAINGLSRYLFAQAKISQALPKKNRCPIELPKIYEDYLAYYQTQRQVPERQVKRTRSVLAALDDDLQKNKIDLSQLRIEQLDAFLAQFLAPFAPATGKVYRSMLRGFLKYLYQKRKIIKRDLAALVVARRAYAQSKPPKFLRPQQMQKLFAALSPCSASAIRTYAMLLLAYTLGLRPKEICRITLDDICFSKAQLSIDDRKCPTPLKLPIPQITTKAIAAYIISARPQSSHRTLFLSLNPPYEPISPSSISHHIKKAMDAVNLASSAYWLRHTYAQNLLESGASIFEIKEMLGHDKIESTKNYLRIHIQLMRKVLFDEIL